MATQQHKEKKQKIIRLSTYGLIFLLLMFLGYTCYRKSVCNTKNVELRDSVYHREVAIKNLIQDNKSKSIAVTRFMRSLDSSNQKLFQLTLDSVQKANRIEKLKEDSIKNRKEIRKIKSELYRAKRELNQLKKDTRRDNKRIKWLIENSHKFYRVGFKKISSSLDVNTMIYTLQMEPIKAEGKEIFKWGGQVHVEISDKGGYKLYDGFVQYRKDNKYSFKLSNGYNGYGKIQVKVNFENIRE